MAASPSERLSRACVQSSFGDFYSALSLGAEQANEILSWVQKHRTEEETPPPIHSGFLSSFAQTFQNSSYMPGAAQRDGKNTGSG